MNQLVCYDIRATQKKKVNSASNGIPSKVTKFEIWGKYEIPTVIGISLMSYPLIFSPLPHLPRATSTFRIQGLVSEAPRREKLFRSRTVIVVDKWSVLFCFSHFQSFTASRGKFWFCSHWQVGCPLPASLLNFFWTLVSQVSCRISSNKFKRRKRKRETHLVYTYIYWIEI